MPTGRYIVQRPRPGFVTRIGGVRRPGGRTTQVLVDIKLTFSVEPIEVRGQSPVEPAPPSPEPRKRATRIGQRHAVGSVLDVAPIQGDDFQSLLPLLPGVVRGADGRFRAKGGQPTQGALQISSASLVDPSSGDFDLELPGQSLESVEVLANPFAAEHGRFSASVTQIRTRRGTNDWEIKPGNLIPRFRGACRHPRL